MIEGDIDLTQNLDFRRGQEEKQEEKANKKKQYEIVPWNDNGRLLYNPIEPKYNNLRELLRNDTRFQQAFDDYRSTSLYWNNLDEYTTISTSSSSPLTFTATINTPYYIASSSPLSDDNVYISHYDTHHNTISLSYVDVYSNLLDEEDDFNTWENLANDPTSATGQVTRNRWRYMRITNDFRTTISFNDNFGFNSEYILDSSNNWLLTDGFTGVKEKEEDFYLPIFGPRKNKSIKSDLTYDCHDNDYHIGDSREYKRDEKNRQCKQTLWHLNDKEYYDDKKKSNFDADCDDALYDIFITNHKHEKSNYRYGIPWFENLPHRIYEDYVDDLDEEKDYSSYLTNMSWIGIH